MPGKRWGMLCGHLSPPSTQVPPVVSGSGSPRGARAKAERAKAWPTMEPSDPEAGPGRIIGLASTVATDVHRERHDGALASVRATRGHDGALASVRTTGGPIRATTSMGV